MKWFDVNQTKSINEQLIVVEDGGTRIIGQRRDPKCIQIILWIHFF